MKSVLWRVAKGLSYTEDARCLKERNIPLFNDAVNYCDYIVSVIDE